MLEPTDRSESYKLSHLRLSSFVVCLWSQKGSFDVSPNVLVFSAATPINPFAPCVCNTSFGLKDSQGSIMRFARCLTALGNED